MPTNQGAGDPLTPPDNGINTDTQPDAQTKRETESARPQCVAVTRVRDFLAWLPAAHTECVDDKQRIDLLAVLEAAKGGLAAAQARLTIDFAASQTATATDLDAAQADPPDGDPDEPASTNVAGPASSAWQKKLLARSIRGQVTLARKDGPHKGGAHLNLAEALTTDLPFTMGALTRGEISEWQATLISRETATLTPEHRRQVDTALALHLGTIGDKKITEKAREAAYRLDPQAVNARLRRAVRDRRVTLRHAPDSMAYVTALLPAASATVCHAALTAAADIQLAAGDPQLRGRGQIMADEYTHRLSGGLISGCDDDGTPLVTPSRDHDNNDAAGHTNSAADANADSATTAADTEAETEAVPTTSSTAHDQPAHCDSADAADDGQVDRQADDEQENDGRSDNGRAVSEQTDGRADAAEAPVAADTPDDPADPAHAEPETTSTYTSSTPPLPPKPATDDAPPSGSGTSLAIHVHLVMTDQTLLGCGDEPAELIGYGIIPATLARRIAAADLGPNATTWIRRLFTNPDTGQLAAMDSRSRQFPTALKHFLLARDRRCRDPYCGAPGRHPDHVQRHADGGPTSAGNGQLNSADCNWTKEAPGWHHAVQPDGTIIITTPTGHHYDSPQPAPPKTPPWPRISMDPVNQAHPAGWPPSATPNNSADGITAAEWKQRFDDAFAIAATRPPPNSRRRRQRPLTHPPLIRRRTPPVETERVRRRLDILKNRNQ